MTARAVIFGCAGAELSPAEHEFFARVHPLGFILFQRNCRDPEQVRALVAALRETVGGGSVPVLIDQEGGRVARMKPPHWRAAPPAARFGDCAARDPQAGARAVWLNHRLLADELAACGVTVNCAPVLDLRLPGAHEVIGDRAFAADPETVARLGRAACDGLLDGGVLPVVKHIPGHGRAVVDSHFALPEVDCPRDELESSDFRPFAALADAPLAMTGHVVFRAIDAERPVTLSPIVVQDVIRGAIGFQGLLLTDDLSMQALSGDLTHRVERALAAGCDVILHCNGKMEEMTEVAAATPELSDSAARRLSDAYHRLPKKVAPMDRAASLQELDAFVDRG